ncbi:phage tail assembly protein [Sansalvadorimonas verongulae]|uniref:phage tail assembly protein n=1 Tax=Sansalvadorimonas verongulae TaxID=2172824 RepID=UPI0012BB9A16|nr:phage tail assembly protein [Sansalvadorimonas verongulae]MTI13427.1 phage tail assembly protein [Sansalvadorimonas verongulae]
MNDYTETVVFTRPYQLSTGKVQSVEMREPTSRDQINALKATTKVSHDKELRDYEKERFICANCTDLTPDDLDTLHDCDYERMALTLMLLRTDPDQREKMRKGFALPQSVEEQTALGKPQAELPQDTIPE